MKTLPKKTDIAKKYGMPIDTINNSVNRGQKNAIASAIVAQECNACASTHYDDLLAELATNGASIALVKSIALGIDGDTYTMQVLLDSMAWIADKLQPLVSDLFIGSNRRLGEFISFRYKGLCFELYLAGSEHTVLQFGSVRMAMSDECKVEFLKGLIL